MGILNGNVNCDSNTNSLGTSCKYQCDEGFKLVGTDESICSLNEDELGAFWSQNPPFCEAYCGPLPELTHGSYECDGNDLGSTCEVKCSNGTRVDGERSLICKQDNAGMAYWFGDMVQCIRTCPQRMIRTPPLKVDCTSGLEVGSYCTFGCTNEAMLHGSKNVKCQIDSNGIANWSHDFPICRPQCPQIPDREGQRVKCTTGRLGGSECKFSCDPNGWKLAGNTTVQCKIHRERQAIIREERNAHLFDLDPDQDHEMIERAHWSVPNLPSCRRKTCPKLAKLTNGQLACTGYNFEDSCRFKCNEGFLLKGENATECLGGFRIHFNAYKLFDKL